VAKEWGHFRTASVTGMKTVLMPLLETLIDILRSRASLHLEMLAMRQQLAMVADGDRKRLSFRPSERIFWVWLYRLWPTCLQTLMIFKPDTLVRWHRRSAYGSALAMAKSLCGANNWQHPANPDSYRKQKYLQADWQSPVIDPIL